MKQNYYYYLKKRQTVLGLALAALDIVFFATTNPDKVPSALLIVGFVLAALSVYVMWRLVFAAAAIYGLPVRDRGRRPALFLGFVCAAALALQSLGELTLRDIVVLVLFAVITYMYTSYGRSGNRSA